MENQTAKQKAAQLIETAVRDNLTKIDREERFDAMLDECYSFEKVGGPFAHMSPSSVLKECDPTAYRCGVNDWDGDDWTEVDGETYDRREVQEQIDELVSELESEIETLEEEIEEETDGSETVVSEEVNAKTRQCEELRATIAALESYL